eukprot:COSAG02_NODE_1100_length_14582_cov_130.690672_12_plen_378_part_00
MALLLLAVVAAARTSALHGEQPSLVFTAAEVKNCTRIRTPSLAFNPAKGTAHVVARCCGANQCSSKPPSHVAARLGDNDADARVIMKTSSDGGRSWGRLQTLSPHGQVSYANGQAIYDAKRRALIVQYNYIPRGDTKGVYNTTFWQITSVDDGASWSTPRDITHFLAKCNPNISNMQVGTAGSKIQTRSGRLVWAGHDHAGHVCVWYSDDGGLSYTTAPAIEGNEVSLALGAGDGLYMNGRGGSRFGKHRTDYWSTDNGATWSRGTQSGLVEDASGGCEASLLTMDGAIFFLEPVGKHRTAMRASCSRDWARTWASSAAVNGDARGGYSDMKELPGGRILAVWEDGSHPLSSSSYVDPPDPDSGNFFAMQLATAWCK